jgi:hypothetical protein
MLTQVKQDTLRTELSHSKIVSMKKLSRAKVWYVDNSDKFYPSIRRRKGSTPIEDVDEYLTFSEAKKQVLESAKNIIEHWREIAKDTRKLTKKEAEKQEP